MPACEGRLSDGKPCPKNVEDGQTFCQWHNPEDKSWHEVYARLEKSTPEEKTDIVLRLIKEHPEHRLVLPSRFGQRVNLSKSNLQGADLECADLRSANLEDAN